MQGHNSLRKLWGYSATHGAIPSLLENQNKTIRMIETGYIKQVSVYQDLSTHLFTPKHVPQTQFSCEMHRSWSSDEVDQTVLQKQQDDDVRLQLIRVS